jgi:hypothetical protein
MDASRRGYTSILLTPETATGQFHFLRTVRERDTSLVETIALRAQRGTNRLSPA